MDMHYNFGATPYDWEAEWRVQIGETPDEQGKYVDVGLHDGKYYLDKGKLSRLPIIEEPLKFPYPRNTSKCLIIPIYENINRPFITEKVYFKSSLWVVRSLLKNSDIADAEITIKFFIENTLRDRFRPYLHACGLSEDDCIFFEDNKFTQLRNLGKNKYCCRTYMWYHPELLQYTHLMLLDSDTFVRRLHKNKRVSIFEKLTAITDLTPESIWLWYGWYRNKVQDISPAYLHGRSQENFLQRVAEATGKSLETVSVEWTGKTLEGSAYPFLCNGVSVSGKVTWFPIQWFNKEYPDYEEWSEKWIEKFSIDEAMNAVYIYKNKIPIHNFAGLSPLSIQVSSLFHCQKKAAFIDIFNDDR